LRNISDINDIQAESGVICTLLFHPDFILHSDFLKPSHFSDKKNSCIYWAIQELYKSGVDKIDSFNLSSIINSNSAVKKKMEEFDIRSLDELIDLAKNVERNTVDEYLIIARQVTSLAFKRTLYKKLNELQGDCFDDKYDLGKLNTKVYNEIDKIAEDFMLDDTVELFGQKYDSIIKEIKDRQTSNGNYGLPSKFPTFNKYFQYERNELVVYRAKRKMGKSCLLMNECIHKLQNNCAVAYLDSEMSDRNFTERALANLSGVPVYKIKNGSYTPSEEQLINEAGKFLKQSKLCHMYDPNWTFDKIYTCCKTLQYKMGLDFLIFDYMKSGEVDSDRQYNSLGNFTNFLKNNISGGLNIPVATACQSNRKGDVADSFKIEQFCSTEIVLRQKTQDEIETDGEDCGNYAATILLNRNGSQMDEDDYIDLLFDGKTTTISEAKKQHEKKELPI